MVLSMKDFPKKFKKSHKEQKGGVVKVSPAHADEKKVVISKGNEVASPSLVLQGERQQAAILALKIKNQSEIDKVKSNVPETIKNVTSIISENNGRAYKTGNQWIQVFCQILAGTFLKMLQTHF